MATYSLFLLGSPRLECAGAVVRMDTRKALALLAYLAVEAGQHHREALATLLYPDYDSTSARGAFRRTLSTLRNALGGKVLLIEREQVSIHPHAQLWVDVAQFRQLRQMTPAGVPDPDCLLRLQEAADLYRGGFMQGFSLRDSPNYDDWQFYQADGLQRELGDTLEKLAAGYAAQGEFEQATAQARRWLALDPLQEEAYRMLMKLYAWSGERGAALRQYRECVRILAQELKVSPIEETTQLYQAILEGHIPAMPRRESAERSGRPIVPPAEAAEGQPRGAGEIYPLVGRQAERQALQEAYAAARSGGYFFALEGEAGIGKTRLAEAFLEEAAAQGGVVLATRCYEGETGLAYAPFLEIFRAGLSAPEGAERLKSLPQHALSLVEQLLPELRDLFPALPQPPALEAPGAQARFYESLRQVLAAFLQPDSEGAPAGVLLFDDLHWADAASLDLLAYLARRLEGVFLLATWRSDAVPVGGLLRQLLAQAMRQGRGVSLALPRLSAQDVTKIIQAAEARQELPGDLSERLYQETEGNPFFVTEYLKSTLQTGKQQSTAGWDMPVSVRDLIRMRLSGVGEISAQLLSAAAVVGRSFDFATLQAVSGRSELEIIGGLETLLQHQLFVEQAGGDPVNGPAYDFTHDKLRALVYEETSLARRRLLHQRAGEAFAGQARQRPGGASRSGLAAYHFQLAGLPEQAADHFRQAGEHARQLYANREAMAHFQNALACGHPDAASLHEAIGDLQTLSGEYSAALGSYEAAAALGAEEHQPWIDHKLGAVHAQRGDWELAECHFQVALETLGETGDPGERARICVDWSRTAHRRDNPERAQALARQALKLAEGCPDRRALAQAHNMLGVLARGRRKLHLAHKHLRQSLEIAAEMGDSGMRVAALNNLARLHADQGQTEPALALTGEALQLCEQQGDRHRAAALHNNLADLYHTIGDEEQAMAHLKKAVIIFAEIGEQAGEGQSEIWKLAEW